MRGDELGRALFERHEVLSFQEKVFHGVPPPCASLALTRNSHSVTNRSVTCQAGGG